MKSAKNGDGLAHNALTIRFVPSLISRYQQGRPQCAVHREHGVHHLLGSLLDLFLRPFRRLSLRVLRAFAVLSGLARFREGEALSEPDYALARREARPGLVKS